MRFRFSVREILLVIVIVAVALAWRIDRSHWEWVLERDRGLEAATQARVERAHETIRFLLGQNRSLGGNAYVGGFTDVNGNLLETDPE